jgi:hypothetical protein
MFDITGDGRAEHTAWFASGAMLAQDTNHNGTIDGVAELFGTGHGAPDGFTDLANRMDSNADGVVDARDAQWSTLQLWTDANGDGVSQAHEMATLDAMGVKSIALATTETHVVYADGYMPLQGTVTMTDGTTRAIGDVFFTNEGNGELHGSTANDVLVYNPTAHLYNGGTAGYDTLDVMKAGATVDLSQGTTLTHVDAVDMHNGGADVLKLNIHDVLDMNDQHTLIVQGDAVDTLVLTGDVTQGATVQQNGIDYASYTNAAGAHVLVQMGLTVQVDQPHHG